MNTKTVEKTAELHGKELTGKVVSTKMAKTVVVEVEQITRHWLYKKPMRRTKKFSAHYEGSDIKDGDTVIIRETKPLSKTKHFTVTGKVA